MSLNVELINTGSELMLGRVLNTHQQWLCRRLADLGYVVNRQVAVPDTGSDIQQSVREALSRADLIIVTGGLGPTSDDLTRDLIAQLLGRKLNEDAAILERLKGFFKARNRPMPASTAVQAQVPEGALVLTNNNGTAPGLAIEIASNPFRSDPKPALIIMLPGPPRELRPMFDESAIPLIQRAFPLQSPFVCLTLRTVGIGESVVQEKIAPPLESLTRQGLEIGYCARPGQTDVRLTATGPNAAQTVSAAEKIVRNTLGSGIYAVDDQEMEDVIIRLLTERKETLALAESCTGGGIANQLTNVSGASVVVLAGLVTYSNQAKQTLLGVQAETLAEHGAVSEPVARQMAEGARKVTGATYALSVTGIAGPSGGSPAKPAGTVFIALAGPFPTIVERRLHPWDRLTFKQATVLQALDLLRQNLA